MGSYSARGVGLAHALPNNTMNPTSASANGLQRSRVIVVLACPRERGG
jgi:hypothetical protein